MKQPDPDFGELIDSLCDKLDEKVLAEYRLNLWRLAVQSCTIRAVAPDKEAVEHAIKSFQEGLAQVEIPEADRALCSAYLQDAIGDFRREWEAALG